MDSIVQEFVKTVEGTPPGVTDVMVPLAQAQQAAAVLKLLEQVPQLFDPTSGGHNCPFCDGGTGLGAGVHKAYCKRAELKRLMYARRAVPA